VKGLKLEMMRIDWRMALVRKTMFESLRNCKRMDFGMKVMAVYLAV